MSSPETSDAEKIAKMREFLIRVSGFGYLELSRDKIEGEYRYFHKRARELLDELFPRPVSNEPEVPFDDNF